jgi:filamentous hemagglutinin family protein
MKRFFTVAISFCAIAPLSLSAQAQISSDGSLGTIVSRPDDLNFVITHLPTNGPNLFHSFSDFSVPTNGSVVFDLTGSPNVANIFSRVTGNNPSTIDGRIETPAAVNLFLLNPRGIIFGPEAKLDIGGAFLATTAERIQFADGTGFAATTPAAPLLTISTPIGLQFGNTPAAIQQLGSDLRLPDGNPIALLGGGILIEAGQVTSRDGRVAIGSFGSGAQVAIDSSFRLSSGDQTPLQDISLTRGAMLNVDGDSGGYIQVQGRHITLNDAIITNNAFLDALGGETTITAQGNLTIGGLGPGDRNSSIRTQIGTDTIGRGSDIKIQADSIRLTDGGQVVSGLYGAKGQGGNIQVVANTIEAIGSIPNTYIPSGFSNSLGGGASGQGGNTTIQAQKIRLIDGGQIAHGIYAAEGQGGDLTVIAPDITAIGTSADGLLSSAFVNSIGGGASGNAGNLTLQSDQIRLEAGGQILSGVYGGSGNAGKVTVIAKDILAAGVDPQGLYNSGLGTALAEGATGKGGDLLITTGNLTLLGGAQVIGIVNNQAAGQAGNVQVNAENINLSGFDPLGEYRSGLFTAVSNESKANGGNIAIATQTLTISNGAQIAAGVDNNSIGNAGNIEIKVKNISIVGKSDLSPDIHSEISTAIDKTSIGQGGSIAIQADRLTLSDGGQINVSSLGQGAAGNLEIRANRVSLQKMAEINAQTAVGDGGNILLSATEWLSLSDRSLISAAAGGDGNGGNLSLTSPFILGRGNSDLIANAFQGRGGNIQINTSALFGLENRPQITEDNDITASSAFGINGAVQINTLSIDPINGALALPTGLLNPNQQVAQNCQEGSRFVVTGRSGIPLQPTAAMVADRPWTDFRLAIRPTGPAPIPTVSSSHRLAASCSR